MTTLKTAEQQTTLYLFFLSNVGLALKLSPLSLQVLGFFLDVNFVKSFRTGTSC